MPNKLTRKHSGIIQTGGNAGRLKKGFRYSGLKLKSGLPQIVKTTKKTTKRRKQRGGKKINKKCVLLTLSGKSKKGFKKTKGGYWTGRWTLTKVANKFDNLLISPNKFVADSSRLFNKEFYRKLTSGTAWARDEHITIEGKTYKIYRIKDGKFKEVLKAFKDARAKEASDAQKNAYKIVDGIELRKQKGDGAILIELNSKLKKPTMEIEDKIEDLIKAETKLPVPDLTITYQDRPFGFGVSSNDHGKNAYISKIANVEKNKGAILGAQIIMVGKTDVRGMLYKEIMKILRSVPVPVKVGFAM